MGKAGVEVVHANNPALLAKEALDSIDRLCRNDYFGTSSIADRARPQEWDTNRACVKRSLNIIPLDSASNVLHEPTQTARLYDRNFALALASQTCFVVANTLMAHYARWIEFLGGGVRQVGFIMGAGAILGVIVRPWMAQWINRLGSRTMWLIGFAVFSLGSFGNLLVDDLSLALYALRSCLVLGPAIVFASSLTYVSQTAPPHRQTEAIGILGVGGFMGMLLGPALGDVLLSVDRTRGNFVLLFVAAGLGCILPAFLVCCLRLPPGQDARSAVRLKDFLRTTRSNWPGMILLVDLAFGVCMTVPFVFLASYVDQMTLTIPGISVIGLFFWCYAGWGLTIRVILRRVPERFGRRKVLLAGMLSMATGMFCFTLVSDATPWLIVVPALVTGMGHGLMFHTMTALTIESFSMNVRGTGSSLALMMLDLGTIAGAPVLGQIAEVWGFNWMFSAIGLFTLGVAGAYAYSSMPVWQQRRKMPTHEIEMAGSVVEQEDDSLVYRLHS